MVFSSPVFLFFYLPASLAVYYAAPRRWRNLALLLLSLLFYGWGERLYVLIMVLSTAIDYVHGALVEKYRADDRKARRFVAQSVVFNLLLLGFFKYYDFLAANLSLIPGVSLPVLNVHLPIGISFFTFQMLSYIIDVYRGIPAQRNIAYLGLYISFFPQLIAGPIVRYTTVMDEIMERRATREDFAQGALRFLYGLSKKMLLANVLAELVHYAFSAADPSVCFAWLGSVAYTLQIYFDFSGYSDMAIGMGRMFGFHFLENFDYPYMSRSVSEFWRRWHISLGSWFRDYVYFPLGGSRVKTRSRLVLNLVVVWLLTGIWHGANWTYIIWGSIHGLVIIFEKLTRLPERIKGKRPAEIICHILTLLVITFDFVLFRADTLPDAARFISAMLGLRGGAFIDSTTLFYLREYGVTLLAAVVCSTPVFRLLRERVCARGDGAERVYDRASFGVQLVLFAVCVSFLVIGAYNPFIYFNF